MPTRLSWKLSLEVTSGPSSEVVNAVDVDAYDHIEVKVPDTSSAPAATTIDLQPGTAGKVKLLYIHSTKYGDNLKFHVHDNTTTERVLNDKLFLTGAGALALVESSAAPLDKLLVTNTTGQEVAVEIIIGRKAT